MYQVGPLNDFAASKKGAPVDEIVPVLFGFVFGALIWRGPRRLARIALSIAAICVSGYLATFFSGEYRATWLYLLPDFCEALLGFAGGAAALRFAIYRTSRRRHPSPDQ
jgi:hypothetical protein